MEKQVDNEYRDFEAFCKKAMKASSFIRPLIEKCLNSVELTLKGKIEWINLEIKVIEDKIKTFARPEYIEHLGNTRILYELFRKAGLLHNADELSKLEQAMNLYEKFTWLQILLFNTRQMENRLRKQNNHDTLENLNETKMVVASFDTMMVKLDNYIHLATPPNKIGDWVKIAKCHNWDNLEGDYYLGCQINEFKCVIDELFTMNKDLIYANIGRSGLFYSKKGKLITAHHLSTSSYKKLKTRDTIQKIIGEYIKKVGQA